MNMGVLQAQAEKIPADQLARWVKDKNLNKEQTDRLRSHLKTVYMMRKRQ